MHEHQSPLDVLAEEIGSIVGQIERETGLRVTAAISDLQRRDAERELQFANLTRQIEERLASLKDGAPGKDGRDGIDGKDGCDGERGAPGLPGERGAAGADGQNGRDGIDGKDGIHGRDGVDGRNGADGLSGRDGVDGKAGERGEPGPAGALPKVREWTDEICYQSDVVAHAGGLYQATRDTAKSPPHADWICLASPGRDGVDGQSFTIRGTFRDGETYVRLDVVSLNGGSFAAKRDEPGPCPGDGWQLIAMQGGRGKPGERGPQGTSGNQGAKVKALSVSADGVLTFTNDDGSTATCDLYPLLEKVS